MPKPEKPDLPERPTPPAPVSDRGTGAEHAQKVLDDFTKRFDGVKLNVPVYGTQSTVSIKRLETDGAKVSVWMGDKATGDPDVVIVNPPTEIPVSPTQTVVDPVGAIALSMFLNGVVQ